MECIKSIEIKYILTPVSALLTVNYYCLYTFVQSYLSYLSIRSVSLSLKGSGRIVQGMHHPRDALSQGSKIQDGTLRTHCSGIHRPVERLD